MKTQRKSLLSYSSGDKGITMIELLIVMVIMVVIGYTGMTYLGRTKERTRVGAGVNRVLDLKAAMEQMSRECQGYPLRSSSDNWMNLRNIINRYGAGNYPVGSSPQKIEIFPDKHTCDSVSLQNLIQNGLQLSTCDVSTAGCSSMASGNMAQNFNEIFVKDPAAEAICKDPGTNAMITGWNYALVTQGGPYAPSDATKTPVAVYCANVVFRTSSVTVVVNGGGFNASGNAVTDGSGMVDMFGNTLPNACPCAAWCGNNFDGNTGCCKNCNEADGTAHLCHDTDTCYNY